MESIMRTSAGEVEYEYERCSVCANGKVFSPHTKEFLDCHLCKGHGVVVTSHKCACGAPVTTKSPDAHLYCGSTVCLTDLRADAEEDKKTAQLGISRYPHYGQWKGHYGRQWAD